MVEKDLRCLRCGGEMNFCYTEDLQLGRTSIIFGHWPNIHAGALRVDIYCCTGCGRLEFFTADIGDEASSPDMPQVTCPNCGRPHDFDYPRCPYCKHEY